MSANLNKNKKQQVNRQPAAAKSAMSIKKNLPLPTKVAKAAKGQQAKSLMASKVKQPIRLNSGPVVINGRGGTNKASMHPKGAEIANTENMERRLKNRSPWYASLRDPVQGAGARIPDLVGINTATFQCVQNITVQTNVNGINGFCLISPYMISPAAGQYQCLGTSTGSDVNSITFGGADGVKQNLTAEATIVNIAQTHRVVSAAVFAEYEGATLNDTGECTSFVRPFENITASATIPQTYAAYQANYGSVSVPVNKARSKPLVAYWFPCSYDTWEYSDFQSTLNTEYGRIPSLSGTTYSPFWSMGHLFTGLDSAPTVKYTVVVNYEFIPKYNTLDYISASPSPIDPIEEQLVEQWVASDAQTGLVSNKLVDVQPGAQKTDEALQGMSASNMFGMLGSVIKEVAPLLLAL